MTLVVNSSTRSQWLVPTALILLSVVPVAAGADRVAGLAGGAAITPENARFFAAPAPVVVHIITASLYCLVGPFQFVPGFRRRRPGWHRAAGRLLVPCGLAAGLAGLWMALFYPDAPGDGDLLRGFRLVFGTAMVMSIALGFAAIRRRDIARHRAWMIRGYAIALGAGTQVLTSVPWLLFVGKPEGLSRALLLAAGWAINVAVAEWIIRRRIIPGRLAGPGVGGCGGGDDMPAGGDWMKAVVQERFGPPDVLRLADIDRPEAGPDDVLIRVHAAALNPYDWHMLRGTPASRG